MERTMFWSISMHWQVYLKGPVTFSKEQRSDQQVNGLYLLIECWSFKIIFNTWGRGMAPMALIPSPDTQFYEGWGDKEYLESKISSFITKKNAKEKLAIFLALKW